ncbi:hypothetical protein Pmani_034513 [Petrolisthes manimaculis]|uniref:Uncharacterized protein n=1 Tax=Petrolisthes manimaculis TaxID=1843537 RepID=A0AAE1NP89_9EUCA|nr:hypothetical protein Pmani_034513 [Petrolisthes manimaculis]
MRKAVEDDQWQSVLPKSSHREHNKNLSVLSCLVLLGDVVLCPSVQENVPTLTMKENGVDLGVDYGNCF